MQIPWVAVSVQCYFPRLTIAWIHQSEVALVFYISDVGLRCTAMPKNLPQADVAKRYFASMREVPHRHHTGSPELGDFDSNPIALQRRWETLRKQLFTEGYVRLSFVIGEVHCDHYLEGDVPVILKSAAAPASTGAEFDKTSKGRLFFYLSFALNVVDKSLAAIFEEIDVVISPLSVNIEIRVIEQILNAAEKEKSLLRHAGASTRRPRGRNSSPNTPRGSTGGDAPVSPRRALRHQAKDALQRRYPLGFVSHCSASLPLVLPRPHWSELTFRRPVYIKQLRVAQMILIISIRTSEKRIDRHMLHVLDALPLDTPYMAVHIAREKRRDLVAPVGEFIRQSLPSAWLRNPVAFATETVGGIKALCKLTVNGAKENSSAPVVGALSGLRLGAANLFVDMCGGLFQSLAVFGNTLHKALGGSRPRPHDVADGFWMGVHGFFVDTFVKPWVALFEAPFGAVQRGDAPWKISLLVIALLLRCLICPVFGFLHFFTCLCEGFAHSLVGGYEQFAPMEELSDIMDKKKLPN
eukprot:Polyplicarium_translucidae@DN2823_c0_g1_i2.p1